MSSTFCDYLLRYRGLYTACVCMRVSVRLRLGCLIVRGSDGSRASGDQSDLGCSALGSAAGSVLGCWRWLGGCVRVLALSLFACVVGLCLFSLSLALCSGDSRSIHWLRSRSAGASAWVLLRCTGVPAAISGRVIPPLHRPA